jgi:folate-dependent phosphoribosylglycinamide formyltransferase PurN
MRLGVMVSGSGTLLDAMVESGLEVAAVLVDRHCLAEGGWHFATDCRFR